MNVKKGSLLCFSVAIISQVAFCASTNELAGRDLAIAYFYGDGEERSYVKALEASSKIENDATALYIIGFCYENGEGGKEKNPQAANEYYAKAMNFFLKKEDVLTPAEQFMISDCYKKGAGVEKDDDAAFKWCRKSADVGFSEAQCRLAEFFALGEGVETNMTEALKWVRRAVAQNNATAQFLLGLWLNEGYGGMEQNKPESIRLFLKSAVGGNTLSQYCFEKSVKEQHESTNTWQKAAALWDAESQYMLGEFFLDGRGVAPDAVEAVKWFRKSAEQGYAEAQYALGLCYAVGTGVEKNLAESIKLYRSAAEQGFAKAQTALSLCYAKGEGVEENVEEAVKWVKKAVNKELTNDRSMHDLSSDNTDGSTKKDEVNQIKKLRDAAERGDVEAQYSLGLMYATEDSVALSMSEAAKWFRLAGDNGYAEAQVLLGLMYAEGKGVLKDETEAVTWYQKAAEQGHAQAQFNLGACYDYGEGVEKDMVEAVKWYRKAAEQNNVKAEVNLGSCYGSGNGVEKNTVEAVKWLRKAAEQGDAQAQSNLGACYEYGEGVEKDMGEALKWYRKAAEQNNIQAEVNLGSCYRTGNGVKKNVVEAINWFRKAAAQGSAEAHRNLGFYYLNGVGVVQDDIQSCFHYIVASALGDSTTSKLLLPLREKVSPSSYSLAQEMASRWLEKFNAGIEPEALIFDPSPEKTTTMISATGTGFLISSDGYFLTCAHVIEGGKSVKVVVNQKNYLAKVVKVDPVNDVALLKLEGSEFQPLAISQAFSEMGDKVFTVGFPNLDLQGSAAKYTEGSISSLSGIQDDIRTMQITVPLQCGNSGGALVDGFGNAVGLVVAQINAATVLKYTGTIPQNVNFAVKINYALPLVQSVPGLSRRLPTPNLKPFDKLIEVVKSATGLVVVSN